MFHFASFLSAVAALIYQICWLRHWSLIHGSDTYAQATVLSVLMLGFALGGRLSGPLAERTPRPLFWYSIVELGIAAGAMLAVWGVSSSEPLSAWIYQTHGRQPVFLAIFRTLLGFVVLLTPTVLMGATLPLLVRAAADNGGRLARSIASLYSLNTLGAAAGAALAGFVTIAAVGTQRTLFLAVCLNLVVATWAMTRHAVRGAAVPIPPNPDPQPGASRASNPASNPERGSSTPQSQWALLLALAVSGAVLMAYEIAWTRVLALTIGGSVYSYTTVLVTVLIGLGLGNALASWRIQRGPVDTDTVMHALLGIGMTGLVSFLLAGQLPLYLLGLRPLIGETLFATQVYGALLCFALYLGPTICCGLVLPLACAALVEKGRGVARSFATPYAINSAGAVVGSLLAGLFMIQNFGLEGVLRGCTAAVILLALVLRFVLDRGWRLQTLVPGLGLGVLVLALPNWSPQVMASGPYQYGLDHLGQYVRAAGNEDHQTLRGLLEETTTLFHRDGVNSTVSVFELEPGDRWIKVNGKTDAGTLADMRTQILLGVLPVLACPEPRDVCVIGLGSGVTLAAADLVGAQKLDCVEIEDAMVEAAGFFREVNEGILDNPSVELIVGDARNHLLLTDREYDVIISEPSNPWIAGVASLYTREFYQSCRERLRPGGVLGQWVQLYSLEEEDFFLILRTLESEFRYLGLYLLTPGDSLILASDDPIQFPTERLQALRHLTIPEAWRPHVELNAPFAMLRRSFVLDEQGIRSSLVGFDRTNRDDHPILEFRAPRALKRNDWREFCDSFYRASIPGREPYRPDAESWSSGDDLATESLRVARRMRDAGNPAGAADILARLVQHRPQDAKTQFRLAEALEQLGQFQRAAQHREHAISLDPAWLREAISRTVKREPQRAIELSKRLVERYPDSPGAWSCLAQALEATGNEEGAKEARVRATELDPVGVFPGKD